jgi:hypothetical protein
MSTPERKKLLDLMDDTRTKIEVLLPQIDPHNEIYPGWTIRELLAHVTGWDIACIEILRAHEEERPTSLADINDLDEYNVMSISTRSGLDDDQIIKEWRSTRQALRTILEEYPGEKLYTPVTVPWGRRSTVTHLMEMFCRHEKSHTRDVIKWLQHSKKPLMEEGE